MDISTEHTEHAHVNILFFSFVGIQIVCVDCRLWAYGLNIHVILLVVFAFVGVEVE